MRVVGEGGGNCGVGGMEAEVLWPWCVTWLALRVKASGKLLERPSRCLTSYVCLEVVFWFV